MLDDEPPPARLTPRECEVYALTLRGYSQREIAAELFISRWTVKRHMRAVYRKVLGAPDDRETGCAHLQVDLLADALEKMTPRGDIQPT